MRERAQGWVSWIIAGVLCLAFALWGIEYYLGGGGENAPAAKVNGQEITNFQWENTYRRLQQINPLGAQADFNQAIQQGLKSQALQELVQQATLTQAAEKGGYVINNQQLNALITSLPEFQVYGEFSRPIYERVIQQFFSSEHAFLSDIRDKATILQAKAGVTGTTFALPEEVNRTTALADETRDIQYLNIPAKGFLSTVTVSDEDISEYYKANTSEFMTKEALSLAYITLSADEAETKISLDEQTLKEYYQNNIAVFSTTAEWQIAHIVINIPENANQQEMGNAQEKAADVYQKLNAGQDFAMLALTNSDDKTTAIKGGIVGWVKATSQPPAVTQALNQLQVNQFSMPVRTTGGFEIIKLLGIKPSESKPFESVRLQVESDLRQQKISEHLAEQSEQLSNLTYTNPDTLSVAAEDLGLKIEKTPFFGREGSDASALTSNPKVVAIGFSENVLNERNNSDVISLDEKNAVVIRVNEYKPSKPKPLADVRNTIEAQLKQKNANEAAEAKAQKVIASLNDGVSLEKTAETAGASWQNENNVSREGSISLSIEIVKRAFSLPLPQPDKLSLGSANTKEGDVIVVILNKVTPGESSSLDESDREMLRQMIAAEMGALEYYLYTEYYFDKAKIKLMGQ